MSVDLSGWGTGTLLGRALRWPLKLLPRNLAVPVLQGPVRGQRWIIGSGTNGYWLGTYERQKVVRFAAALRPRMVIYDIGANVGYFTLLAASRVGTNGRVAAFEPLPRNIAFLERHLALNRCENVTLLRAAAADHTGPMRFDLGAGPFQGHLAPSGELAVDAFALDDLVRANRIPPPDLMKLDVEGAEADVLGGARWLLGTYHPIIFLATHGPAPHAACCEMLSSLGYSLESADGRPLQETDEIVAFREGHDPS
jgi:FkbM family methyltransferase